MTCTALLLEAPSPDPLNDKALILVVVQPMTETPGHILYPLAEAGGSAVEGILSHVMDAYTMDMPPPSPLTRLLPLPQILPFPLPPPP